MMAILNRIIYLNNKFFPILQKSGKGPVSMVDAWDLATLIGAKYIETSSLMRVSSVIDTFEMLDTNRFYFFPGWSKRRIRHSNLGCSCFVKYVTITTALEKVIMFSLNL